jgi:dihydroxyacid dehydratase/phosphogluconate dehydratase
MDDAKVTALNDLKQLIFKGKLSADVTIEGVVLTVTTLSVAEQTCVFAEANITDTPKEMSQMYAYLPILLKYAIRKVNGVAVISDDLASLLKTATTDTLFKIAAAYWSLFKKEQEATEEIKNTSATPNRVFSGK